MLLKWCYVSFQENPISKLPNMETSLLGAVDVMRGDCGSGVQGLIAGYSPPISSFAGEKDSSGSLRHNVNTCFRIILSSLAWLVWSWSATPEMATNRRCIRSSALAKPPGPLARGDFFPVILVPLFGATATEEEWPLCSCSGQWRLFNISHVMTSYY